MYCVKVCIGKLKANLGCLTVSLSTFDLCVYCYYVLRDGGFIQHTNEGQRTTLWTTPLLIPSHGCGQCLCLLICLWPLYPVLRQGLSRIWSSPISWPASLGLSPCLGFGYSTGRLGTALGGSAQHWGVCTSPNLALCMSAWG